MILILSLLLLLLQQQQWFVNAGKLRSTLNTDDKATAVAQVKPMERRLQDEEECVGTILRPGDSLQRNQFLCSGINFFGRHYYKFGIKPNGFFGQWRIDEGTGKETLHWTIPSTSKNEGETLIVDPESGNLHFLDIDNNLLWTNDCYAVGSRFVITEFRGVESHSPEDQRVWSAFFRSCQSPIYCKGNVLQRGDRLLRNEYLCPEEWDRGYARTQIVFGLNHKGQLGHFQNPLDDVLLLDFDSQAGIRADRLVLQKDDGNLVLYSEDNAPLWASTKKCSGWTLERRASSAVVLLESDGETVVRYFDTNGDLSDCFPQVSLGLFDFPLPSRFGSDPRCRLSLIDHRNELYTILQVEKEDTLQYKLTANIGDNFCGLQKTTEFLNVLPSSATIVTASGGGNNTGASYPCPEFDDVADLGEDEPMGTPPSLGYDFMRDKHRPCSPFGKMLLYCAVINGDLYS